ncbi:unnamed protein product [Closterium sp. NIES-64]|nr:unnamed protein product [Closterium sp. NIES-64]
MERRHVYDRKFPIGPRTGELAVWRNVFLVVRAPQEGQYGFMLCDKEHKQDNFGGPLPHDAFTRLSANPSPVFLCDVSTHTPIPIPEPGQHHDNITFDPGFLFPNDAFTRLAHAMADSMGGPHRFDYVHIKRGDKLNATRWPHLDRDTRPESRLTTLLCCPPLSCRPTPLLPAPLLPACPSSAAPSLSHSSLLQKLPSLVPPNSTLYIATNEPDPHFFDPLKTAYTVHNLADFASLWGEGSAWEAEMREVAASVGVAVGKSVEFDSEMQVLVDYALKSEMQVLVDYAIKKLARRMVETSNDLTDDPKDGAVDFAIKKLARRTVEADDPKDGEMRWGVVGDAVL